ncbi:MAG: CHASE2 domain-containing protein [Hydrogenophaga sp.]|uniref:CHASE2 domain-containing protein n=1 Tax=Hydrogenophaga sp. TaxID=1904254 RepID=UPI00257E8D97|nr:CHASE2 domain-containing protein [Hydrogenophaga sp.]MBL0943746.1 CHASE2 domain-containing protein [Hydrogenophaga sp.]
MRADGRGRTGPPAWLVTLCTVLVGAALGWLSNFIDAEETIKRVAGRNFMPLLSLNYGDKGQRSITVVTIDDGDLREYGLTWPVPLDFHGRLIQNIARHGPRAIFLDVVFLDDRPQAQVEALRKLVCEVAQSGVAVYFASFQRADLSSNVDRMLTQARFQRVVDGTAGTGEPCARPVRAQLAHDRLDQNAWTYPLNPPPAPGSEGRPRLPSSVAHTLYCRFESAHCPRDTSEPMALLWPTQAAESNARIMVTLDDQGRHQPVCRGRHAWYESLPFSGLALGLWAWSKGEDVSARVPLCPYNQVLPATALKRVGFTEEQLRDIINGDYVLIGADLAAVNDHVISPVHGRLPGVHAHAVALDNLITRNGEYLGGGSFEWPRPGAWVPTRATAFTFASLALIAGVLVPLKAMLRRRRHAGQTCTDRPRDWRRLARAVAAARARPWLGLVALFALAGLLVHLGLPPRLLLLPPVLLLVLMLGFGQPVFGSNPAHRQVLRHRAFELAVLAGLSLVITWLGFCVFRQGPLVIVEYMGLTALANVLGVGERVARHTDALAHALASRRPVRSWNEHARRESAKSLSD